MARLVVATAAAVIAGVVTQNPAVAFQVFGLVPGYGPQQVRLRATPPHSESTNEPTSREGDK